MGWEKSVSELIAGRKIAERRQLRDLQVDGNRPRIGVFGFPVGCRFGLNGERDCFGLLIGEKRLEKHLVDIFAARITGERPDLVTQNSVGQLPDVTEEFCMRSMTRAPTSSPRSASNTAPIKMGLVALCCPWRFGWERFITQSQL